MTRTRDELIEGLKHVGYEVWMTGEAAARLAQPIADGVVHNALVESMLLHMRSLTDFFLRTSTYASDIRRTDFVRPDWTPAPAAEAQRLLAGQETLHKHLSHLTWERTEDGKQGHDLAAAVDTTRIADAWCTHLGAHDAALYKEFRPFVLAALKAIERPAPYQVVRGVVTTSG